MKITFDLTIEDWMAFQEYYKGRKAPFYKILPTLLIITAIVLIALNVILYFTSHDTSLINLFSFVLLFLIFYILYLKKKSGGQLRKIALDLKEKNPDAFGPRDMIFGEEGIEIKTAVSSKKLTWEEMDQYEESKEYFYLYSKKGVAYIIPKGKINVDAQVFEKTFKWKMGESGRQRKIN